jgi:hypothetical protein
MKIYTGFSNWLDSHLSQNLSVDIVAVNFNLYESSDNTYEVELVGCNMFSESDSDWACSEIFTTRDDLYFIPMTSDIFHWEQGLLFVSKLVIKYLHEGIFADKLKHYKAVSIGFADGDLNIIYRTV